MKLTKVYKSEDALPMMGIPFTKSTADRFIYNMVEAGLFHKPYKKGRRYAIDEEDIVYIRQLVDSGKYKPTCEQRKQAA